MDNNIYNKNKIQIIYFYNVDTNAHVDILNKILKFWGKWTTKFSLVWNSALIHAYNKDKVFYL